MCVCLCLKYVSHVRTNRLDNDVGVQSIYASSNFITKQINIWVAKRTSKVLTLPVTTVQSVDHVQ